MACSSTSYGCAKRTAYVLRESAVQRGGERLGAVGGRIVGEVLVGIISSDPESYLAIDPNWTPTLRRHEHDFRVRDLLIPPGFPRRSRSRAGASSGLDARRTALETDNSNQHRRPTHTMAASLS
jgi:hypothetical protein